MTDTPNFGLLLAPVLGGVPPDALPRMLSLLERSAADRYRAWADEVPEFREQLLGCAASEDEIADLIDAAFACDEATLAELRALMPEARSIYYAAFDGVEVRRQLAMQADAELQGAQAWRNISSRLDDSERSAAQRVALARCSALEEHSSQIVRAVLAS